MEMRTLAAGAAIISTLFLSGCVGGGSSGGNASGSPSTMSLAIFGNPGNIPPEKNMTVETNYTCPTVDITEGAAAFRMGRQGGSDVGHQASLIDVARECLFADKTVTMKVGVQGRMLLGAAGKPGTYTIPVRVAVKRNDKVITSRFARVSVTIPSGETGVSFTHIEQNIVLPITEVDPGDDYEVYVGFDANGGAADPRSGRRKRR